MYRVDVPAEPVDTCPIGDPVAGSAGGPSSSGEPAAASPIRRSPPGDQLGQITLWLRRGDQTLFGLLLIALLVLLIAFRWKLSGGLRTPIEIVSQHPREYFYSIDINNASWVEWAQLDGIGEKLARRIVKDREDHGAFRSVDDVRRVRGLGPKLIEKLRPFLTCADDGSHPSDGLGVKEPR